MNQESETERKSIKYVVIWLILFAYSFGMVVSVLMFFSQNHGGFEVYRMNQGWKVQYCGRRYYNANLSIINKELSHVTVKRNDMLSLQKKIDIKDDRRRLTLRLYSRMSSVRVSIIDRSGNEQIIFFYGYGDGEHNTGDFLGSGYHFIQLPQDCRGKTLKIMEMASEDDAFDGVPSIVVTESDHAMEYFAQERSLGIFITIFMIISGVAVAVLSVFMLGLDNNFYNITIIGMFSAVSGLWCMSSMKAIEMFSIDIARNSTLEYVSMYLMTVPLMWLSIRFFKKTKPVIKTVFFESMLVNIILVIVACICQYAGLFNIDHMVKIFHLIIAFDALSLTTLSIVRWHKAELPERFFETGILFAAVISVVYMVFYYGGKNSSNPGTFELTIMPVALLFMVIMMILGYISDLYKRRIDHAQRDRLKSLAYTDDMTGLYNRTMGEKRLKELDKSGDSYLLINMDLNFLKKVNDIAGHVAGDRYISTFATILNQIFGDSDAICRMGGDEFLVIYSASVPGEAELKKRFTRMEELEKEKSDFLPKGISVDASYGYAYSHEFPGEPSSAVFGFADRRMYQMKVLSKKGRTD